MDLGGSILVIVFTSIVIYFLGNKFADASSNIGDYFKLSRAVKGATFDAIASSLPELLVALFAVIFFNQFEVGIGTIAGSALFNLLVIPGICVFVSPKIFKVSKEVLSRDALFYIISVFILLVLVLYFKTWGIMIAIGLILVYLIYIKEIIVYTKKNKEKPKSNGIKLSKELIIAFFTVVGIGIATYFLTESAINLSEILNVSPIIIAFTVIAAATSLPDAVISIGNAKKGNLDDATSNVFGSNIFDILIGLGLPLLIYYFLVGSVTIVFEHLEIILGLLFSTIIALYFFMNDDILSKKEGFILLIFYVIFVLYVIFLGI